MSIIDEIQQQIDKLWCYTRGKVVAREILLSWDAYRDFLACLSLTNHPPKADTISMGAIPVTLVRQRRNPRVELIVEVL